jgi:hypothetical protein
MYAECIRTRCSTSLTTSRCDCVTLRIQNMARHGFNSRKLLRLPVFFVQECCEMFRSMCSVIGKLLSIVISTNFYIFIKVYCPVAQWLRLLTSIWNSILKKIWLIVLSWPRSGRKPWIFVWNSLLGLKYHKSYRHRNHDFEKSLPTVWTLEVKVVFISMIRISTSSYAMNFAPCMSTQITPTSVIVVYLILNSLKSVVSTHNIFTIFINAWRIKMWSERLDLEEGR